MVRLIKCFDIFSDILCPSVKNKSIFTLFKRDSRRRDSTTWNKWRARCQKLSYARRIDNTWFYSQRPTFIDDFKNFAEHVDFKRHTGVRAQRRLRVRASEKIVEWANIYFPAPTKRASRVTYRNVLPLCKLLSIRERFFFVLYSPPPRRFSCYRKPLNSWSFRGRRAVERTSALSNE